MGSIDRRFYPIVAISIILLMISIVMGIAFGSVGIEPNVVYKVLANRISGMSLFDVTWNEMYNTIVWELRLPRVLQGALVGAGLAVAGVLMQVLTKNPIADPYLLGISSGASTGAVAVIVLGGISSLGVTSIATGAFLGAMLSGIIVFLIGTEFGRRASTTRIVLTGIAVSTIFSAMTSMLIYSAKNPQQANTAIFWTMGSLGGAKWDALLLPCIIVLVGLICSYYFSRSLDVLLLGDEAASIVGMNGIRIKMFILIIATLMTSTLVAISGTIGFVGLIIPHICRKLVGSNHKKVLIMSMLVGAIFLIWADVAARSLFPPKEIPIGIITALLGGPFFLWLLRKDSYSFGGK